MAKIDGQALGAEAFAAGRVRIVPTDIIVNGGMIAATAWYRGWDAANLAAPVEGWTDEENAALTAWRAAGR